MGWMSGRTDWFNENPCGWKPEVFCRRGMIEKALPLGIWSALSANGWECWPVYSGTCPDKHFAQDGRYKIRAQTLHRSTVQDNKWSTIRQSMAFFYEKEFNIFFSKTLKATPPTLCQCKKHPWPTYTHLTSTPFKANFTITAGVPSKKAIHQNLQLRHFQLL